MDEGCCFHLEHCRRLGWALFLCLEKSKKPENPKGPWFLWKPQRELSFNFRCDITYFYLPDKCDRRPRTYQVNDDLHKRSANTSLACQLAFRRKILSIFCSAVAVPTKAKSCCVFFIIIFRESLFVNRLIGMFVSTGFFWSFDLACAVRYETAWFYFFVFVFFVCHVGLICRRFLLFFL